MIQLAKSSELLGVKVPSVVTRTSRISPATNAVGSLVFLVSVTLVVVLEVFVFRRVKT